MNSTEELHTKYGLSPKLFKVVLEYTNGATRANAIRAGGYNENMALKDQNKIFGRADVIRAIRERQREMTERAEVTEDWIVQRLMKIADASVGDLITIDEEGNPGIDYSRMNNKLRYALSGIQVDRLKSGRGPGATDVHRIKVTQADKLRALEMLGKYKGMFVEKVELSAEAALIKALQEGRKRAFVDEPGDEVAE